MLQTDSAALIFQGVSKIYPDAAGGPLAALRDVSFELPRGARVAIVGRSGSGKSTLLHLAAAIDLPTRGSVWIEGQDLRQMPDRERTLLRRQSIGLVFQFYHLLPHLTVLENILLPEWIAGGRASEFEPRARQLLEETGLAGRAREDLRRLSGGEMQRVAICRALLRRPTLLLADEPTGNLDDRSGREVMELMLRLSASQGSTLVYVTHSREVARLADQVWQLRSGVLRTDSP